MTTTTSKAPKDAQMAAFGGAVQEETPDEAIARLEAERLRLNAQWKPLRRNSPPLITVASSPAAYGPHIQRQGIALQIADVEIALATLRGDVARTRLAEAEAAVLARNYAAEIATKRETVAGLEAKLDEARRILRQLQAEAQEARQGPDRLREAVKQADFDLDRWTQERARDQAMLDEARLRQRVLADNKAQAG